MPMEQPFLEFARASIVNWYGLGTIASSIIGTIGLFFRFRSNGDAVMSRIQARLWQKWPTSIWIIGWMGSLIFLWLGCFQAWNNEHTTLTALKNEHPLIHFGEARRNTLNRSKKPYWDFEIDVISKGVIGASPYLVSICQVRDKQCNPDLTFSNKRKIGWHKSFESSEPVDLNGTEHAIPFIIDQSGKKVFVYMVGKNGSQEHDNLCEWCDNIPNGKYKFVLGVDGKNSSAESTYIFDWSGDVTTSNISERAN